MNKAEKQIIARLFYESLDTLIKDFQSKGMEISMFYDSPIMVEGTYFYYDDCIEQEEDE